MKSVGQIQTETLPSALSEDLKLAGRDLLAITDSLGLDAQAAMWIYDHLLEDWRFYLVTELIETEGRRRIYQLFLEAFAKIPLPGEMIVDDIHLGSVNDPLFQMISNIMSIDNSMFEFTNCDVNGVMFDAVVYRSLRNVQIAKPRLRAKLFAKAVRELAHG